MNDLNETIYGSSIKLDESGKAVITGGSLETVSGVDNIAQTLVLRVAKEFRRFRNKSSGETNLEALKAKLETSLAQDARTITNLVASLKIDSRNKNVRLTVTVQLIREDNAENDIATAEVVV